MKPIDILEHGGAGDDTLPAVRHLGYEWPLDDPRARNYQWILMALAVESIPSIPGDIPVWKHSAAFDHWCAAWDLPSFNEARRLAYLVDHYRGPLVHDLLVHAGVDLGTLWRARKWRTLLDVIDRLPGHSHYSAAVANDEEHAKMVAEAMAARRDQGEPAPDTGPSLTGWSPEVAAITRLTDAVNSVRYAVLASQLGKKAGEPPKPERRPVTALERAMRRAEYKRRQAKHEALVARVLPHKADVKG